MPARLLLIALDAAEPTALESGIADGRYPALASIARRGAHGSLVGLHETLSDTVWPELRTGRSGISTGVYYQPRQFRSGEAYARSLRADELAPDTFYWNLAGRAGRTVAAVDLPLAPPGGTDGVVEISGWATHDRPFPTVPGEGEARRIVHDVGQYPIWECNRLNDGTADGRRRLLARIHEGIDRKADLLRRLLDAREWDLFTTAFSESHCVGHHFWPEADEEGDPTRGDPGSATITEVYQHLDQAVGEVLDGIADETTVVVYSSHGMAPVDDGALIVGEVLTRLGLMTGNRRRRSLATMIPERVRGRIHAVVGSRTLQRAGLTRDRSIADHRAVPLPNSRTGAIRLSLAGRDPGGHFEPGSDDHEAVLAAITAGFRDLRLPDGTPAVAEVVEADHAFGVDRHPDLPDLVIRFRGDRGRITEVESDALGSIRTRRPNHRTGEHGTPGAIWVAGPGIAPGAALGDVATIDLAPSVLHRLDVPPPHRADGTPIPGLI